MDFSVICFVFLGDFFKFSLSNAQHCKEVVCDWHEQKGAKKERTCTSSKEFRFSDADRVIYLVRTNFAKESLDWEEILRVNMNFKRVL